MSEATIDRRNPLTLLADDGQERERYDVVLADKDASTLAATRDALERDGFHVVAEAQSATEAVAAVLRYEPKVCLLEVDLPGDGIAASREIHARLPDTRIAMLCDSISEHEVLRAIRAGADGYLLKTSDQGRLAVALRALAVGEPALPRSLMTHFVQQLRETDRPTDRGRYGVLGRAVLYGPRFARHFRRRRRSRMSVPAAWRSARLRMKTYR